MLPSVLLPDALQRGRENSAGGGGCLDFACCRVATESQEMQLARLVEPPQRPRHREKITTGNTQWSVTDERKNLA